MEIVRFEVKDRLTQTIWTECNGSCYGVGCNYLISDLWNAVGYVLVPIRDDIIASIDTEDNW